MVEQGYDNSELYHHGILGQKWGVRRFQNPDGSLTPEGRERYSSDNKERSVVNRVKQGAHDLAVKRAVKTGKGLSVLSDDELRDALNRRNTELNYKRTMDSLNPKKVHKGRQILSDALERTARGALYKLSDKLVGKMFNDSDDELEDEVRRQSALSRLRALQEESENAEVDKEIRGNRRQIDLAKSRSDLEGVEVANNIRRLDDIYKEYQNASKTSQIENMNAMRAKLDNALKESVADAMSTFDRAYNEAGTDSSKRDQAIMGLASYMSTLSQIQSALSGSGKGSNIADLVKKLAAEVETE